MTEHRGVIVFCEIKGDKLLPISTEGLGAGLPPRQFACNHGVHRPGAARQGPFADEHGSRPVATGA